LNQEVNATFADDTLPGKLLARIALLERRISREVRARQEAEALLEAKSLALYGANQLLLHANCGLEERVAERTKQLTQARDEALAASKAKSTFLANMSHELRTPLNAIIGFSETMKLELLGPLENGDYRGYAEGIYDSGRHLLSIINDLLDLAKFEAGRMELHEETCDFASIVDEATRLLKDGATQAGLSLHTELPLELPPIKCDPGKIRQILLNLLSNAIKFTPPQGMVTVSARLSASGAFVITVTDTGIGIPAPQIDAVLEAFVQVENVLSRSHAGTGLGLPLCKAMAELHGGFLVLESEIGKGTRVTVSLPKQRVAA